MPETTQDAEDELVVKPFAAVLQEIKRGRLHDELSKELHELIAAVTDTGKPGVITLQIKVEPAKKTRGNMLVLADHVQVKKPTAERDVSYWFITPDGNLSKDDVNQPTIPGITVIQPNRKEAK